MRSNPSSPRVGNAPTGSTNSIERPLLARPASAAAGFPRCGHSFQTPTDNPTHCRPFERGPNVSLPGVAVAPRTSRPMPGIILPLPDDQPEAGFLCPRSPGGNARFMRPPCGALRRSPRSSCRPPRAWPVAAQRLPTLDYDIHVFGVQLDPAADTLWRFRGR
jgi:hypothetical protein